MNTYNKYIMFLSDLMAIEPPTVIYQKDGKAATFKLHTVHFKQLQSRRTKRLPGIFRICL